jgi:hypothetical protein
MRFLPLFFMDLLLEPRSRGLKDFRFQKIYLKAQAWAVLEKVLMQRQCFHRQC